MILISQINLTNLPDAHLPLISDLNNSALLYRSVGQKYCMLISLNGMIVKICYYQYIKVKIDKLNSKGLMEF